MSIEVHERKKTLYILVLEKKINNKRSYFYVCMKREKNSGPKINEKGASKI